MVAPESVIGQIDSRRPWCPQKPALREIEESGRTTLP